VSFFTALREKWRKKRCVQFIAQQMPKDVGNKEDNLQCERQSCRFPEFMGGDPEENVCYDEGEDSPLNRRIQRANEFISHYQYCSSLFAICARAGACGFFRFPLPLKYKKRLAALIVCFVEVAGIEPASKK
jgi:hypothetical protein